MIRSHSSLLFGLVVALLSVSASMGCESPSRGAAISASASSDNGARVDGDEARRLVSEEGAFLLDVRTPAEFSGGHLEGATNIPVSDLTARLGDVPADQPVVVYCQSGGRSATAARELVAAGRTVYDLGSMSAW